MNYRNYDSPQLTFVELEIEQAVLSASGTTINDYPGIFPGEEELI